MTRGNNSIGANVDAHWKWVAYNLERGGGDDHGVPESISHCIGTNINAAATKVVRQRQNVGGQWIDRT